MNRLLSALRGILPASTSPPDGDGPDPDDDRPALFQCPACETVYLAIEKSRCSSCTVAVTPV